MLRNIQMNCLEYSEMENKLGDIEEVDFEDVI